jgi:hypothetical protein
VRSIVLDWVEIKTYCETIGPDRGRPPRPTACCFCDWRRVWFDGWRVVFAVVLVDGTVHRFDDGLCLQRVKCARCKAAWTLYPPWMCPRKQFQLDVVEVAALGYLAEPMATYRAVAKAVGCSPTSVWRWVGWCATVAEPGAIVAQVAMMQTPTPAADLSPRRVPQTHDKAHSAERAAVLLLCLQVLFALGCWSRALPHPSPDPCPLRAYVVGRFLRLREILPLPRPIASPRMQHHQRAPPV